MGLRPGIFDHTTTRRLGAGLASLALALGLGACDDDDTSSVAPDDPAVTETDGTDRDPGSDETDTDERDERDGDRPDEGDVEDEPSDEARGTPADEEVLAFDAQCQLADAPVTVGHPADWVASGDCTAFDPERVPQASDDFAIGLRVVETDFASAVDGSEAEERQLAVVDGHRAVRTVEHSELRNGPVVVWRIDLDDATGEQGGTLVASTSNAGVVRPGILDRMATSLAIASDAQPDDGTVIARAEGGGRPYTVVATDDDCLALYGATIEGDPLDEDCALDAAGLEDAGAVTTRLALSTDVEVVAGFAGDGVTAVAPAATGPTFRVVHTEDGRGFGFMATRDDQQVALLAGDGSRIAEVTV